MGMVKRKGNFNPSFVHYFVKFIFSSTTLYIGGLFSISLHRLVLALNVNRFAGIFLKHLR